jgi:hypothetical protein
MSNAEQNLLSGFIKLSRSINKHWIWQDAEKLKWWIDILIEVNHTDREVLIGERVITCKRGQSLYSLETWAKRWRVDKSKVRRFLELLKKENMIVTENVQKTTHLTVCNYASYNDKQHDSETKVKRKRNDSEPILTPTKEGEELEKKDKKEKNSFDDFWGLYDKKVGDKEKLEKKWFSLTDEERAAIFEHIPKYKESTPDKQYRKDPQTFLNNKSWNDEIIKPAQNSQNGATIRSIAPNGGKPDRNRGINQLTGIIENDLSQLNQ